MQGAGAAEREQRVLPRVDAALDGHDAKRAHHLGVGDADDPLGAGERIEVEFAGERGDRALGCVAVERDAAGERRVGAEVAEEQVRVGHRRLGPAAPVAGGPGLGPGGARPDAQRAARVPPRDRSAARADGVHGEHRQRERPVGDLAGTSLLHGAVVDDADIT